MRKANFIIVLSLLCLLLASCNAKENTTGNPEKKIVYAMDTAIMLTAYGESAAKTLELSEKEIQRIDTAMSRAKSDGEICPLNAVGSGRVSDETAYVLETALDICNSTNGAFDITVAPVMDAWGFWGHEYRVPDKTELNEALSKVGYKNVLVKKNGVTLSNGAALDLGGIAKGYANNRVTRIFKDNGIECGLISFGSAIQAVGTKPDGSKWKIGITDPQNKDGHIVALELSEKCIVTSGSYEQVFEENGQRYHHIIDPSTGYPANSGLASVSIIADSGIKADGLSTALFVMGLDKATEYWKTNGGFDMVLITDENTVYYTEGLADSLTALHGAETNLIS